jgi:hypothetical protein
LRYAKSLQESPAYNSGSNGAGYLT